MALQGKCNNCDVVWTWGTSRMDYTKPAKRSRNGFDVRVDAAYCTKYNCPERLGTWRIGRLVTKGDVPLAKCACPGCGQPLARTSSLSKSEWLACSNPAADGFVAKLGPEVTDALRHAAYTRVMVAKSKRTPFATTSDWLNKSGLASPPCFDANGNPVP